MRIYILGLLLSVVSVGFAQEKVNSVLSLAEYLSYVKAYHPIVKQVNLTINESEAKLLKTRGAFDPKIAIDFSTKEFKNKEYYNKLNTTFKIPTWYGVELKANYEENTGIYLNPEVTTPLDGLYSAGVSVSLAKGLLMNTRMAQIQQAKLFLNQAKEEQQILVNEILYNASLSYFNWLKAYNEKIVFERFLENAETRFSATKKAFIAGEKPEIDTLEAGITLKTRKLNLEKARIKFIKSSLELSNFLWLNNNTPIELQDSIIPDVTTYQQVDNTFNIALFNFDINEHPKIKSLAYKKKSLAIEKKLSLNNLLPKVDVQYNFLTQEYQRLNSLNSNDYKAGINFSMPLFLRKERGDLKLAKIKLKNIELESKSTEITIQNKVNALQQELTSYQLQNTYTTSIVKDYNTLLKAEERKFFLGESSLFLVNSRESKLIDSELKAIALEYTFFKTKAELFKTVVFSILENKNKTL